MADLDSKDFPLLSALKNTDRITLTDSNTGQQFASIEVSTFLEQMATLIPTATQSKKGLAPNLEQLGTFKFTNEIDFNNVKFFSCIGTVNGENSPFKGLVQTILTLPCNGDWVIQLSFNISSGNYAYRYFRSGKTWTTWTTKAM